MLIECLDNVNVKFLINHDHLRTTLDEINKLSLHGGINKLSLKFWKVGTNKESPNFRDKMISDHVKPLTDFTLFGSIYYKFIVHFY